jgi:F420-dependent oxidoreductase-like protein
VRFGLFVPQGWRLDLVGVSDDKHWRTMLDVARVADAAGSGFESVWVYDHFHTVPRPSEQATHEAWTLMASLAAATERVRLGQMCTCMAYRNPAYLAKVAATVDLVSGGRVEMGIGAGWYEHEWRAYGYGFPSAGRRIGALAEGVEVMRQLWTDGVATLHGQHYDIDGAICRPLPLQRPHIPFWVAGGGERKTLRIAAQHAQYTNFDGTPDAFRHKSSVLEQHCVDVGRDYGEITRSANYNVVIGATERDVQNRLDWIRDHYRQVLSEDRARRERSAFEKGPAVGTPKQIVELFRELERDGMTYALCYFAEAAYDRSGIELFQREVIPALR